MRKPRQVGVHNKKTRPKPADKNAKKPDNDKDMITWGLRHAVVAGLGRRSQDPTDQLVPWKRHRSMLCSLGLEEVPGMLSDKAGSRNTSQANNLAALKRLSMFVGSYYINKR